MMVPDTTGLDFSGMLAMVGAGTRQLRQGRL